MPTTEELAAADLARSGLDPKAAEAAGFSYVDDASEVLEDFQKLPALVISYLDPLTGETMTFEREGEDLPFCRIRYLEEPPHTKGFRKTKFRKYDQPSKSGVHVYFPSCEAVNWPEVFENVETPIVITEGEKKALVGCLNDIPVIGLGGVYNFMQGDCLASPLADMELGGRTLYICYDSDAATNPNIQAAEGRLATELSLNHGADVFLARLPKLAKSDKTGLDDYILAKGADAFLDILADAPQMRRIDSAVAGLNASVAWVEKEGMVYDTEAGEWMAKASFEKGSRFSALKIQVPSSKGPKPKYVSVATEFLTHPHARRYQEVVFNPDVQEREIDAGGGRKSYNLWDGFEAQDGDVGPFLELTEFLFSELPEDQQELPLRLYAYKAQNPGEKPPLATVLIGQQGCGKSLWAGIVREAFEPYGVAISSSALLSEFNGWIEKALIGVIDEAQAVHLTKGRDKLKNLISEKRQPLRDLYRPVRQIDSYAMYILTSNERRVGAYANDDRRMIVVSTPKKREDAFYDRVVAWRNAGGPRKLMGWLLNYDLKGWTPPKEAPLTAEKYMAYMENLTPIERLAEEMKTASYNVVLMWIEQSLQWVKTAEVGDNRGEASQAREIRDALSRMQVRPFYTPEELAMMFPAIVGQLHGFQSGTTPAGEISRALREAGINYLRCKDNPRGFEWRGTIRQYLVIADADDWSQPLSQKEFERVMKEFPQYGMRNA